MTAKLKAPFPWFGGKREAAATVWRAFGDVPNYVEPFAGSMAVLLGRPHEPHTETVNDLDGLLANFWRAVKANPEAVAKTADWPVSEADLHARHLALVEARADITARLMGDAEWHDAKLAGWWVWGACAWIGSGWCSGDGPWVRGESGELVLGNAGRGINRQLPHLGDAGRGINRKLPHLGDAGQGINRKLPHLGNAGRGINRQLPHLGDAGQGILDAMTALAERLRRVRIACGDWQRVCGDSVTWRHGMTGVFLDPPYAEGSMRYSAQTEAVAAAAAAWAREAGKHPLLRIALCGHDGEHVMPGWVAVPWTARGGYGNQGGEDEADNRHREVIWFSPACLSSQTQRGLFEALEARP